MNSILERYTGLVDDHSAFTDACSQPLPETVWMHPLREAAAALSHLDRDAVSWRQHAWRLRAERDEEFTRSWLLGGWHFQEESALLAARLLDAAPGEYILDLCAAPGNKTAELALSVGLTGTVVANDISRARAGIIQTTVNRLGLVNVVMTIQDGTRWPGPSNAFDAVMVDAPCSCEGTCRKNPDVLVAQQNREAHQALQVRLLSEAVRLVRPGGRICYATCTFAPEENEAVLDRVLRRHPGVTVEPASISGLRTDPGITQWKGATYHPDVRNALRLWPHRNDTGGFFAALLRKPDAPSRPHADRTAPSGPGPAHPRIHGLPSGESPWVHLGLPASVSESLGCLAGSKYDRLVNAAIRLPVGIEPSAVGLPGRNLKYGDRRLSTAAVQFLAPHVTDGWVDIPESAIQWFLDRKDVPVTRASASADQLAVLVARSGPIGLGLAEPFRNEEQTDRVRSRFPKIWGGR
ncbi:MAG: RsmB/NOP family class I SAM-dependent RNA methyltransferase [Rhodothermales bacterium]